MLCLAVVGVYVHKLVGIMLFFKLGAASAYQFRPRGWIVRHKMVNLQQLRSTLSEREERLRNRLEDFGQMFMIEIHVKDVQYGDSNWFTDMSSEHVTLLHVADVPAVSALDGSKKDGSNVSCLVLPPRLKWPTYSQDRALAFRVIVLKSSPLTVLSSHGPTSILQLLLEGNQVALIGHPGIGKVADMNAPWPDLFQALRAKKITTLFYRLGTVLYQFTYERESVRCTVVKQAGNTLDSLAEFFADTPKNVILVLEREDDEVDPVFQVPTVVTASLCDEYYGLKTWGKCGRLCHCDRPPHTFEELSVLCAAYYQEDRPIFLENLDFSYAHTLADAQAEIESRISFVGPLARVVLGSERTYRLHKNAMRDARNTHEFLQYVGSHDSTYLPKYANYFLAPMPMENWPFIARMLRD